MRMGSKTIMKKRKLSGIREPERPDIFRQAVSKFWWCLVLSP
jgi:hypothetical protein